ncbi:glycogen debranching protein [Butyrivibrio sp. VCB2001]|uniref:glycogen debranching protein n=1 Tax=Butyrivibrio sp. VCB2001 TaxID=1280667 RepID=UPI0003FEAA8B|nr:alpha-amylase family glycosyl hydrolase [Butyrivibrio sp. VCB2001]
MYKTIDGIRCKRGNPLPFGVSLTNDGGINFSVNSRDATSCTLELYKDSGKAFASIEIPGEFKSGSNYSITIYGLDPEKISYTYRFGGKFDESLGLRFDPSFCLLDPYAKIITGREIWQKDISKPLRGKILTQEFEWKDDALKELSFDDLLIYELHVRGFTMDCGSMIKNKGTYAGIVEMIPYLKELGINCIELLPTFEFDDLEYNGTFEGKTLYNYWGYNTVGFFAPKAAYAKGGAATKAVSEFKTMVQKLHQNDIRIILDVVFNHTAEYVPPLGDTYNFRGIDNRTYYILGENGEYKDFTACGNTFKCNDPIVIGFILDCLRYWKTEYHIDGFRFDEGAVLSRSVDGTPMEHPPVLEAISLDPILSSSYLIAEAIDASGLYQVGSYPAPGHWGEWNDKFSHCVRKFIKGDADAGPELIRRIKGSPDIFGGTCPHSPVNYVTCHDGFTMNDLVSYNERHNLENGWDNSDGIAENYSWNCGVEGPTDDPETEALRNRQVKNFFALLMLSRGTPMMLAGDEIRNSQQGNNNVFSRDGKISWINWENMEKHKDVLDFYKKMTALRNAHPIIRKEAPERSLKEGGYPDLSFHGTEPWSLDENAPFLTFGFMYCEPSEDSFIYCGVNAFWERQSLRLPIIPEGLTWSVYAYTADEEEPGIGDGGYIDIESRSLIVLVAEPAERPKKK